MKLNGHLYLLGTIQNSPPKHLNRSFASILLRPKCQESMMED